MSGIPGSFDPGRSEAFERSAVQPSMIDRLLTTAAGTLAGSGAAVQLFEPPSALRSHVLLSNCGAGVMYVGFDSSLSSTRFLYSLQNGDPPLELNIGPGIPLYVRPDATGNDYLAYEVRKR